MFMVMGRPKKPEGEVRENFLRIRLTLEERKTLDAAASAGGAETSTWGREALLRLAKRLAAKT